MAVVGATVVGAAAAAPPPFLLAARRCFLVCFFPAGASAGAGAGAGVGGTTGVSVTTAAALLAAVGVSTAGGGRTGDLSEDESKPFFPLAAAFEFIMNGVAVGSGSIISSIANEGL